MVGALGGRRGRGVRHRDGRDHGHRTGHGEVVREPVRERRRPAHDQRDRRGRRPQVHPRQAAHRTGLGLRHGRFRRGPQPVARRDRRHGRQRRQQSDGGGAGTSPTATPTPTATEKPTSTSTEAPTGKPTTPPTGGAGTGGAHRPRRAARTSRSRPPGMRRRCPDRDATA
ncbi:hypothetical protein ACU686_37060 [Yinghuangia aomiensis]